MLKSPKLIFLRLFMSINMQKNYSSRFMELSLSLAEQAFKGK